MKVPDPRVAISALISDPSHVSLPDGKLQFVIFRRDLVSAAPTEVFVRVVARLDQEMKFSGNAPPTVSKIEDQWAILATRRLFSEGAANVALGLFAFTSCC